MSEKRYVVQLSEEERAILIGVVNAERVAFRKRRRAQILLKVDGGEHGPAWTDEGAAEAFDVHVVSVQNTEDVERDGRWAGRVQTRPALFRDENERS